MNPPDDDFEDEIEVALANDVAPWVMTPQWILIAASGNAVKLYGLLLAHVNQGRGDHAAYPLVKDLCVWLGFSPKQPRSVKKYADELVALGALKVTQRYDARGMKTRNKYVLHHNPPSGFTGDRSIPEFYRRRKKEEAAAQSVVRSSAPRSSQAKRDENRVSAGDSVVRSSAPRSAVQRTSVVRSSAPQLEELRTRRTNPLPDASAASAPAEDQGKGEGSSKKMNDIESLIDEVVALRPDWRREKVRAALQLPGVQERPRKLWGPALLAVAADPATQYPGRLAHDGPWWKTAIPTQTRRTTDLAPAEVVELAARREEAQRTVDASSHAAAVRAQLKSAKQ